MSDIYTLENELDLKQNLNVYMICKQFDTLHLVFNIYDDGQVFQSDKDGNGNITRIAQEKYTEILNPQNPQPTTEETLSKEVASLKTSDMKKDAVIISALQTIANLKVEIMKLKVGMHNGILEDVL